MKELLIQHLAEDTAQQLRGMGLSESTLSFYQNESFRLIIRFFKERGIQCYDYDVMCEYLRFEYSRFQRGEINLKRLRALELGANRFMRVAEGQKLEWRVCSRGTHITLSPTYQTLLEDYLSSLHQAESTISGKAAVVRRYLSYLHLQGRDTPSDWSIRDLKQFILETIDEYNSKSHLLSALRDFHAYLSKCGAVDFAYETAMMCPSTPRKKVLPCFTEEELSQIFYSIDTSSAVGKRDYAMLMLAVKTGLRTIDISRLYLSDIRWEQGEIRIVQQKTMQPLSLPLDSSVMDAVADYILNGRQQTQSKCVFLRDRAPFQGFHDGHAIAHMFRRRMKSAGLAKKNGDGRSIHALRRTLGTAMAKADVPLSMISQVLGHQSTDAVKRYISLEEDHLKRCALSLSGIEITRKELIGDV